MLFLIILLPIFGFLSGSLFGRVLGKGVCFITTLFTFISCLISINLLIDVITFGNTYILVLQEWIYSDTIKVDWSFCFDSLTCVMLVIVTFISSLVHLYSTEYMENDPHLPRFMSYLSLFTFFMLILVTANNFLQMFVGWEGVGISSYLLINFWFTRIQANKAAIKAMLVNRIGDFFLLLGMFTIYFVFNTLDYDVVFNLIPLIIDQKIIIGIYNINIIDFICILLFLGAMGKSAQLGLHTWLPDAMEGPTPVSALIHAATMVTAGVFLVIRCSYIFEYSSIGLSFVTLIGAITAFFAATTGLFQNDIKKVIAYSTCSQLGYMVFACGLSSYDVGIFHLSNHAFFKALLFLGAGSIIHAMSDEQDMRKMGGLKNLLPFTYSIMLIGSLALIGFPFLAGFYSKDVILEVSASTYTIMGQFSFILGILAAFCTAFYSTRLLYLVFLSNPNGNKNIILNVHEGSWRMTLPLFLLSILSVIIGYLSKDMFIGFGTNFWGTAIFINPVNYALTDIEFLDLKYKLLPFIVTILGVYIAYSIYTYKLTEYYTFKQSNLAKNIFNFFNKKWYFDRIYNEYVVQNILYVSYNYFYQVIDRGIIEKLGPSGISFIIIKVVDVIKIYQTGFMLHYLAYFFCGILLFIILSIKNSLLTFILLVVYLYLFPNIIKK
ncbi:MAG: NADH-ubiquinone oxidoreductase chain 5 [Bacteroidota bacterium]|nr:NADH-ubiquinone oxidoreductase chain 5 [Bacteroidota bacterium]